MYNIPIKEQYVLECSIHAVLACLVGILHTKGVQSLKDSLLHIWQHIIMCLFFQEWFSEFASFSHNYNFFYIIT